MIFQKTKRVLGYRVIHCQSMSEAVMLRIIFYLMVAVMVVMTHMIQTLDLLSGAVLQISDDLYVNVKTVKVLPKK